MLWEEHVLVVSRDENIGRFKMEATSPIGHERTNLHLMRSNVLDYKSYLDIWWTLHHRAIVFSYKSCLDSNVCSHKLVVLVHDR